MGVIQSPSLSSQACRRNDALEVDQRLVDFEGQRLITEHMAVAVIQTLCGQGEGTLAGNFAVLVGDRGEVFQQQLTRRMDQATGVIKSAVIHVQAHVAGAVELPTVALVQAREAGGKCLVTGDVAVKTVVHVPCRQRQAISTGQAPATLVIQRAGRDAHSAVTDHFAAAVVDAGAAHGQRHRAEQLAAAVGQYAAGVQIQSRTAAEAAAVVVQCRGLQGQALVTAYGALLIVQLVEFQAQCAVR